MLFEPECLKDVASLKTHATLGDDPFRPSDHFLRLHFHKCLIVRACLGDVQEDYEEQARISWKNSVYLMTRSMHMIRAGRYASVCIPLDTKNESLSSPFA